MKRRLTALLLVTAMLFCFASCSDGETDLHSQTAAGFADEENPVVIDPFEEKTANKEVSGDEVKCEKWTDNGRTLGFIMRFSKKTMIDHDLANPENVYYGIVTESKSKKIVIPTEDIQISDDITTGEYVIKMLYSSDKKGDAEISFCLSQREEYGDSMLFCAKSGCNLS